MTEPVAPAPFHFLVIRFHSCRVLRHTRECGTNTHMREQRRFRATHLAELLDTHERSQLWLARKVGVSQSLMHYIVHGQRTMGIEVAQSIADTFNVPVFFFASELTDASDVLAEVA